ncbi:uncharacterized protein [Dysidea avara]|uniref:uncharacterized protein isoform X2 n=1 Tax=Dysidea avara TaxID=196820 RepID=UPI0033222881
MYCSSLKLRSLAHCVASLHLLAYVNGQVCTVPNSVGSVFQTGGGPIGTSQTYILTGYTVQCEGIVTTWEFCYQILGAVSSVTFNPGIWERTGGTTYSLIQSNTVTFNPSVGSTFSCQNYTLPVTEQFTAPSGSVVGLYSNINVLLLRTLDNSQITTYQVTGNQNSVVGRSSNDANYNIAIRVHLVPGTSSTTTPVMSTTLTPVMSTTSTPVMSTTSTPVMATTSTPVMATTSSSVMSTTSTPVMATTSSSVMSITSTLVMATTSAVAMSMTPTPGGAATQSSVMSTALTLSVPTASVLSMPDMNTISTSSMSTLGMSTTSTMSVTTTTNTVDNESGSSSSAVAGIIVGCILGVVVCVIVFLLIIILLWYRKRKKGKLNIPPMTFSLANHGLGCEPITDSSHQYSTVDYPEQSVIKQVGHDKRNAKPEYDYPNDPDCGVNSKPYEYLIPGETSPTDRPKLASNDYEVVEHPDEYSSAQRAYSDILYDTVQHSNALEDISAHSTTYDDTRVSGSPSGDDDYYSDPGHSEEAIYAYFESKKFRIISANTVKMSQQLGSGEFGVVHLGTWTDGSADPIQVAAKVLHPKWSKSERVRFLREAAIMGQFKDNHIVRLYGVATKKDNTMIILEYMPKGDLREFLINLKNMTPPETCGEKKHDLLRFCRQISLGLVYLTSKLFVHRDLAARNILVASDDVCKIADFGMARDVSDDTYYVSTGGKIPLKWTAPEAIFYKKYSTQSDVWSFGCVMYEIWSLGHKPFEDCSAKEYMNKVTRGYRLPPPPGCSRAIYQLMIRCWNPLPNKRINPREISRTLEESNVTLLTPSDSEESSTKLGASLDTSTHLFTILQNTYVPK